MHGCRSFTGLDGCFLKSPFGGQLLTAISVDGYHGLYPLAMTVVEAECKDSWKFFLGHLEWHAR